MSDRPIERKLLAILYADVAGYSRLTGVDEEGTHRRLSEYMDAFSAAIEEGGGHVVHYAGDAILADFGSVVDALNCAVSVQRDLKSRNETANKDRRVEFRIGINLGEVMVDRNDIYGDGVNVAARLEGLADVGGICVSEAVYTQVRGRVDFGFERLGRQRVKNIADPVVAYRVVVDGQARIFKQHLQQKLAWISPKRIAVGTVLLLALVIVAGGWGLSVSDERIDTAPSVAVAPFRVIGGGTEPFAFSDGLTIDLVTELSKQTELRIVAPPAGAAAGPSNDPVAAKARYRVEGSVRQAEGRVRITAQLVGVEKGFHLWGARFDREFKDTLAVQEDVAKKIVAALAARLTEAEAERVETGVTPMGLLVTGMEQLGRLGEGAVSAQSSVFEWLLGGANDG
ncbi:MAG: adenylate/guanylate cyclase domain-containing protein [Rhodospirillales bacterium]|jgi:adenylate cyclase|nr:adenylate/guanylate cyclase domain-containing protein [Rhodospirillales bacterium]